MNATELFLLRQLFVRVLQHIERRETCAIDYSQLPLSARCPGQGIASMMRTLELRAGVILCNESLLRHYVRGLFASGIKESYRTFACGPVLFCWRRLKQ